MSFSKSMKTLSIPAKNAIMPTRKTPSTVSTQYESPPSKNRLSSSSLERVSPFITPKGSLTLERPLTSASTSRGYQPEQLKPAHIQTLNKSSSTVLTTTVTPLKSIRRVQTHRSISSEKKRPLSPYGKQKYEENQETSQQMREVGAQIFTAARENKTIEEQLKILENRIEKLKKEEQTATKRLQKTQQLCHKIVDNKTRHHNDLTNSQIMKRLQMEEVINQRKRQIEAKMKMNQGILKSLVKTINKKNQQHNEVKQTLAQAKDLYAKELAEKNKKRDKIKHEIQELRQRIVQGRINREESAREHSLVTRKQDKLDTERSRQEKLNKCLGKLIQEEEILLEKIRATNTLQESEYKKIEHVYSFKVSAEKPLDLSFL